MPHQTQRYVSCDEPDSPLGHIKLCVLSNSHWTVPPTAMRTLNHYHISYLVEGTGTFGDELGFRRTVRPGDLVCFFPGVKHFFAPTDNGQWTRFFIAFEGPVFDLWRKEGLLDPRQPVVHLEPVGYWLGRLQGIIDSHQPFWSGRSLIEISRLQEFLAEAYCHRQNNSQLPADKKWLAQICQSIEESLCPSIDLKGTARKAGMSYASFRSRFTRLTGLAPGRYRALRLMAKACHLVVHTHLTGKEIAHTLGFADEFHFSRRFKQITGHAPREFRQLYRLSGGVEIEQPWRTAERAVSALLNPHPTGTGGVDGPALTIPRSRQRNAGAASAG